MAKSTDTGMNRTGVGFSPVRCEAMLDAVKKGDGAVPLENTGIADIERVYALEAEVIGNVPPPASLKGIVTTAKEMLKGNKPTVLMDKLGERLAFERTGVRLYDALIMKCEARGSWDGGPTLADLEHIRDEELAHFQLIHECIERLGADPTAMTPSADLAGVESSGVLKTISDPRATLPEALHAQLIAERADVDGWTMLIELAEAAGQTSLVDEFRQAHQREEAHAAKVKSWVSAAASADMKRELGSAQESHPAGSA
ncbi:MAG: ferritin-like domain-containing protein [Aquisalimonadaceae bacterium]